MNAADILVSIILAVVLVGAVALNRRRRKRGCCGCGENCSGNCTACGKYGKDRKCRKA